MLEDSLEESSRYMESYRGHQDNLDFLKAFEKYNPEKYSEAREYWEEKINVYSEEIYKKTGFRWGETVKFWDKHEDPPVMKEGRIEVVDLDGGGVCAGVCTSFDIQTDDLYHKHVPISDVFHVT